MILLSILYAPNRYSHGREVLRHEIAHRNGNQVALDGHRLFELGVSGRAGGVDGTHQPRHFGRIPELGVVGELDRGRVLAGQQGARINWLALAEQERVLLATRLGWRQPLQTASRGTCGVHERENDPEIDLKEIFNYQIFKTFFRDVY